MIEYETSLNHQQSSGDSATQQLRRENTELRAKLDLCKRELTRMSGHKLMQVAQPARELLNKIKI